MRWTGMDPCRREPTGTTRGTTRTKDEGSFVTTWKFQNRRRGSVRGGDAMPRPRGGEIVAVRFKINSADGRGGATDVDAAGWPGAPRVCPTPTLSHCLGDFCGGLYVAMEYLPRTLLEILDDTNGAGLPSEDVRLYVHQLCDAVAFVHALPRDRVQRHQAGESARGRRKAPEAVRLWVRQGGSTTRTPGNSRGKDPLTDYVATRWYRAPELLGQPYAGAGPGAAADEVRSARGPVGRQVPHGGADGQWKTTLFPGDSDVDQLRLLQRCLGRLTPGQMMAF